MPVRVSLSSLEKARWYEHVIRFALGGAATVFAGLIGTWLGTAVGGLFLALPAIFCASATLIESQERHEKEKAGMSGRRRGQQAAALDAAGAGLGSVGLITFAAVFFVSIPASVAGAFLGAVLAWSAVSVSAWWLRRKLRIVHRHRGESARRRSADGHQHLVS